ncbi:MAG: hypothetical protein Q9220_001769 [cf. Caloplaca sp. 1 TL-2023]
MASLKKEDVVESLTSLLHDVQSMPENIFDNDPGRQKLVQKTTSLKNQLTSPVERIFGELCAQPHLSVAAKIALEAGCFNVLADGNPKTARDIASNTGAEPELVARIMMVLTATDVVKEQGFRTYMATPVTQTLLEPGWANGFRHIFDHGGPSLMNLPTYLKRNGYKVPQDVKTGPFADVWGMNTWELYKAEPKRGEVFNSFMTKWKAGTRMWTESYPAKDRLCSMIDSPDQVLLVDIGGGGGHVLREFVKDPEHLTGRLILQDLPATLGDRDSLKAQGIEAMPHDFFTPQPVIGAKAYYLRGILHDWPDRACREILSNTATAMKKGYSRLLIDEVVLPDTNVPARGAFLDLTMMAIETGAERTSTQWHELLSSIGLHVEKIWSTGAGLESVIEAVLKH